MTYFDRVRGPIFQLDLTAITLPAWAVIPNEFNTYWGQVGPDFGLPTTFWV
jgi:hypothetical protein